MAARESLEVAGSLAAIVFAGVVVITCAGERPPSVPVASASAEPVTSAPIAPADPPIASAAPEVPSAPIAVAAPVPAARVPEGALPLPRLYDALRTLKSGTRGDHVRIVWLGDSHTAADLWTGAVRRVLQSKFGDGGPGFVHVGWDAPKYRHDGIKVDTVLSWNTEPVPYARTKKSDDGVFGLGGVRLSPVEGDARAIVELVDKNVGGDGTTWDLAYRTGDGGALHVELGGSEADLPAQGDEAGSTGIRHHRFRGGKTGKMEVAITKGRPQLFGVTIEGDKPGVVLDTVGLNGARMGTFLAWDEGTWSAELARRKPDLVVIAFGTNESSDPTPTVDRYKGQLAELLGRVRAGAPKAECLVVLPMDRSGVDHEKRLATIARGLEAAAKDGSCATWSAFTAMGGAGSIDAWAHESPPRAGPDGVHLSAKGYQYLGERLASEIVSSLDAGR